MAFADGSTKTSTISKALKFNSRKLYWFAAIAFLALMGRAPAAQAANFNFTYAPGTTLDQMIGFEMAGQFWSTYLADDVSLNIMVEMTDYLPDNVIGGALPGISANQSYETFRQQLAKGITSAADQSIFDHQQDDLDKFTALIDGNKVDNNYTLKMTRANAKALGMLDSHNQGFDGYILMRNLPTTTGSGSKGGGGKGGGGKGDGNGCNTTRGCGKHKQVKGSNHEGLEGISWSYDFVNSVDSNSLDYLSVAIHELGHTLGFISGIDQVDWLAERNSYNENNIDDYYASLTGTLNNATPVDLLRFSSASNQASGSGDSWIDMSIGGGSYFSIDGGNTATAYFAGGENADIGGDGYQASHWKYEADNVLGIMDPLLGLGERREITTLDKQLFDAIGWDLQNGSTDLAALNTLAKEHLAQQLGMTVQELEANPKAVAALTPEWIDGDGDGYDDRGELLNDMVVSSEVYDWGWSGFWWGYSGFWWGWSGFWQSTDELNQDGFWQNMAWQTVNSPTKKVQMKPDPASPASVPEPTSIFGLLGLGGMGLGSLYRRKRKDSAR
ncbi:MAG: NF038122 family metalloprotease [Leptolyngbyaceae cyanobacterium MO_188.B28]|nr:NF038122 family metalloprotease [Leptolyngbyaceae cyanobacterium MO_188.B28]